VREVLADAAPRRDDLRQRSRDLGRAGGIGEGRVDPVVQIEQRLAECVPGPEETAVQRAQHLVERHRGCRLQEVVGRPALGIQDLPGFADRDFEARADRCAGPGLHFGRGADLHFLVPVRNGEEFHPVAEIIVVGIHRYPWVNVQTPGQHRLGVRVLGPETQLGEALGGRQTIGVFGAVRETEAHRGASVQSMVKVIWSVPPDIPWCAKKASSN
jgi:hypothetical protein